MTDKIDETVARLPERIWAGRVDGFGGWHEAPDFVNNVEYVRADLMAAAETELEQAVFFINLHRDRAEAAERDRADRAEAERVAEWNRRREADASRDAINAAWYSMRADRDLVQADRDRLAKELSEARFSLREISRETYTDNIGDRWPTRGATIARAALTKGDTP
jgi:hypothetical protein